MKFKATDEQIKKIAALAVNASRGAGMGMLHFKPKVYTPEEIDLNFAQFDFERRARGSNRPVIDLDYYEGRMVKLRVKGTGEPGEFEIMGGEPRSDYQSWARTYPTNADLLRAAGVAV